MIRLLITFGLLLTMISIVCWIVIPPIFNSLATLSGSPQYHYATIISAALPFLLVFFFVIFIIIMHSREK